MSTKKTSRKKAKKKAVKRKTKPERKVIIRKGECMVCESSCMVMIDYESEEQICYPCFTNVNKVFGSFLKLNPDVEKKIKSYQSANNQVDRLFEELELVNSSNVQDCCSWSGTDVCDCEDGDC